MFSALITAWRFAGWPTRRSPLLVNATTDGVSRLPSALVMTTGSPPSITATTELVVPKSMPMTFAILSYLPQPVMVGYYVLAYASASLGLDLLFRRLYPLSQTDYSALIT